MKSRRAALASPSLAGASICTPTASSLISTFHIHPKQKKIQSINTDPKYNNVYVCMNVYNNGGTCDGGGFGARLGVDGDSHRGRRDWPNTGWKIVVGGFYGGGRRLSWPGRVGFRIGLRFFALLGRWHSVQYSICFQERIKNKGYEYI